MVAGGSGATREKIATGADRARGAAAPKWPSGAAGSQRFICCEKAPDKLGALRGEGAYRFCLLRHGAALYAPLWGGSGGAAKYAHGQPPKQQQPEHGGGASPKESATQGEMAGTERNGAADGGGCCGKVRCVLRRRRGASAADRRGLRLRAAAIKS